jgi:hypothetical protein
MTITIRITSDMGALANLGGPDFARDHRGRVRQAEIDEDGWAVAEDAKFSPGVYTIIPEVATIPVRELDLAVTEYIDSLDGRRVRTKEVQRHFNVSTSRWSSRETKNAAGRVRRSLERLAKAGRVRKSSAYDNGNEWRSGSPEILAHEKARQDQRRLESEQAERLAVHLGLAKPGARDRRGVLDYGFRVKLSNPQFIDLCERLGVKLEDTAPIQPIDEDEDDE